MRTVDKNDLLQLLREKRFPWPATKGEDGKYRCIKCRKDLELPDFDDDPAYHFHTALDHAVSCINKFVKEKEKENEPET